MLNRRNFLKYTALAGTTFVVAGSGVSCTQSESTDTSDSDVSQSPASSDLQEVKIGIMTWVGYGPFFVAQDQGLFEKYGINAEVLIMDDPGPRRTALAKQDIQFATSTLDMFATEVAEELPATCIMKLNDSYGADGIIATQDITNIVDLQGKRIAVEKGSPSHFFLLYLLKREGLTPEDVELQYMPTAGDAAAAFAGGNADAAVTWEPYVSETVKQVENAHILTTSKEKFGLLLDVLIVNTDYAGTKPDVVEGVMRAWFDAVEFWQENPDIANAVMAQGLGVSVMDLEAMLSGTQFADYAENQNYFGLTSDSPGQFFEVFEEAQNIWLAEGITAKTVPTESVTDTSFLERMSG